MTILSSRSGPGMKKLLSTFMKAKLTQAVFLCAGLLFSFSALTGCGGGGAVSTEQGTQAAGPDRTETKEKVTSVVSERTVMVESRNGSVEAYDGKETTYLVEGDKLLSGMEITTGFEADLTLLLDADKHIYAAGKTKFKIVALGRSDSSRTRIDLVTGTLVSGLDNRLGKDDTFAVTTPNAVMAVRGTVFTVGVTKSKGEYITKLTVTEGSVETATIEDGAERKVTVSAGETAEFEGEAPEIEPEPEEIKAYRDERKDGDKRFEEYREKNGILYPDQYDENGENVKYYIVRGTLVRFEEYFKEEYDHYMSLDGGVGFCPDVFVFDEPMTMPDGSVVREVQAGFDDRGPGGNGRNIPRDRKMEFIGNLDYVDNGAAWKRGGESDTTAYLDPIVFGDHAWHFYIYDYH